MRLVDPDTKSLHPPKPLSAILESLVRNTSDKNRLTVELVSEKPEPIVKIINPAERYKQEKETKEKRKKSRVQEKEIQMTWGVASGDLEHKLKKARSELQDGNKVNIVYAPKKGQVLPPPAEMQRKIKEITSMLADVGQQWKPPVIERNNGVIYLRGLNKASE